MLLKFTCCCILLEKYQKLDTFIEPHLCETPNLCALRVEKKPMQYSVFFFNTENSEEESCTEDYRHKPCVNSMFAEMQAICVN